jgi:hypothetical protein
MRRTQATRYRPSCKIGCLEKLNLEEGKTTMLHAKLLRVAADRDYKITSRYLRTERGGQT